MSPPSIANRDAWRGRWWVARTMVVPAGESRLAAARPRWRLLAAGCMLVSGVPASADAPLMPAPMQICSLRGGACAARDTDGRTATVWRKNARGARVLPWSAHISSPRLQVSEDGRSLIEIYPGLNLLSADAGPDTVVLVFHRAAQPPVAVRLREVIVDVAHLPPTASHRQWARAYGYDGNGTFLLETAEGRQLRFDPATGRQRAAPAIRRRDSGAARRGD